MAISQGPARTRRRLRAELRALREANGLSIEQAANQVEWSNSKLTRIEHGQVGLTVTDLEALLRIYGEKDPARVEELKELARTSRGRTWWSSYQRHLSPAYQEFIGAEADASAIHHYHPTVISGLLQTEAYAEALNNGLAPSPRPTDAAHALVEVRMMRQRHVLNHSDSPTYVAMVDEAALRRPVGGRAILRAQLDHLCELAEYEALTLAVIPFSVGAHPGLSGAFALMEYDDLDPVVCLESSQGNLVLRDRRDLVDKYRSAINRLLEVSLLDKDAVGFIRDVRQG